MIKRGCIIALALAAACSCAWGIPAKHGLRTYSQPDGTKVQFQTVGDEFYHNLIDSEGRIMARDADGFFRPVSDAERAERYAQGVARRGRRNMPLRRAQMENASQVPYKGSPKVPIILVQYKDYKFKDSDANATFRKFFAEGATSAHQYFYDQSNGLFNPQFDVYGPYTLPQNRTYYGGNDRDGYDKAVGEMVAKGCLGLDSQIDFSKYDNDGDGECDVVIVLYAGDGEASSMDDDAEDAVWPCQWSLSGSEYGRSLMLDLTKVDLFAVFNELNGSNLNKIDGIGTFCHEFSHCLGLPDFYDTQYGPHFGMSSWSLMDYGSYNDDGYTPIGYSAYEKEFMGWIEIPEAKANTFYTLPAMNQKSAATDMAVRLTNDADPNEYYILENRKKQGWDAYMPAEGLMISHFTYSAAAWDANEVNDYDLQRATIIPADNSLKINKQSYYGQVYYEVDEKDLLTDLWPQPGATELTDTSKPAAKVNKGGYMSKPITEITRNSDSTISFYAMKAPLPSLAVPSSLSHSLLSTTSARISWECADHENVGSYTLEVAPHVENPYTLLSAADFSSDAAGWSTSGYSAFEDGGIRLGSSNNLGSLISPSLKVEDAHEMVTIAFVAKSWSNDNASTRVSLLNSNGTTISSQDIPLSTNYKDYLVTFPATSATTFKIKFENLAKKKRFFVASATIYSGDFSEETRALRASSQPALLFEGISGNSYVVDGLTPGASYDYRVRAISADDQTYNHSAWSQKMLLDMSDLTGVTVPVMDASASERWFTLQGLELSGRPSAAGIYIRVKDSKTEKVLIPVSQR